MDTILSHKAIEANESLSLSTRALRLCITEEISESEAISVVNDELLANLLFTPYPLVELGL